jgi:ComF family protein
VCCGEDLFQPANDGGAAYCRACRMVPPGFERAVSYGVYEGSLRAILHALKFDGMTPLMTRLGGLLAEAIAQLAPKAMLVIPVPLHRSRMAERGFNQAETLAAEALRVLRQSHPQWRLELSSRSLVRQRSTDSQAGLNPRQRRQNLRGVFFVPEGGLVQRRHVLLVDDIYTTGATARACSKVLLKAGAASVRVATIARAQRRFPQFIEKRQRYIQGSTSADSSPVSTGQVTIH